MSDNAKNGIIDLTDIVEMGTPPVEEAKAAPVEDSVTVDFEKELEDLFTSSDFSEFTESKKEIEDPAAVASDAEHDAQDVLTDLDAELAAELAQPEPEAMESAAPQVPSELDALLDEADSADSAPSVEPDIEPTAGADVEASMSSDIGSDIGGFDADFEDLLNDLSGNSEPGTPPNFDEDLSAMSEPKKDDLFDSIELDEAIVAEQTSGGADVDDLLSELDLDLESLSDTSSQPEPAAASLSTGSGEDTSLAEGSLDDPFDVDALLNEVSDDLEPAQSAAPAQQDDTFDLEALDQLLETAEERPAPHGDVPASEGITLEEEDVDMDDVSFLLSELEEKESSAAGSAPAVEEVAPEPVFEEPVAEPAADSFEMPVVEEVEPAPAEPVDGSMFDAEIDALLDDLEMASSEPVESLRTSQPAEDAPVEAVAAPVEEILEAAPVVEEPVIEPAADVIPEPVAVEAPVMEEAPAQDVDFADLANDVDIDALLEGDMLEVNDTPVAEVSDLDAELEAILDEAAEGGAEPQAASPSPLGTPDEFESILDEVDSLIDQQGGAMEPEIEFQPVEAGQEELVHPELQDAPQAVAEEPVIEPVEVAAQQVDQLPEPNSLEEDMDSTLDRILGEEPLASEEVVEVQEAPIEDVASFTHDDIDDIFEQAQIGEETAPEAEMVEEIAVESVPVETVADEAFAELESVAQEMQAQMPADVSGQDAFDMQAIDENAAPVPPDANIEDLMREATVSAPEFSGSNMEVLDTMPAVSSAIQDQPDDVPPAAAMTPEEFAELTERIYYLETTLQNVVAMQEAQATPVVDKEVLKEAVDEAFKIDGPLMARVLSAVEVRTESMLDAMGNKIESEMKSVIDKAAAKSAAQVIREEIQGLLGDGE